MRTIVIAALLGVLAGCGAETTPGENPLPREIIEELVEESGNTAAPAGDSSLPAYFDCLRENDALVIATHRAGPAPGFPENALETMQNALEAGFTVFEIDVAESRDGVLFLMHDRSLGRTTTLDGAVVDTDWENISSARLIDNAGTVTDFTPQNSPMSSSGRWKTMRLSNWIANPPPASATSSRPYALQAQRTTPSSSPMTTMMPARLPASRRT